MTRNSPNTEKFLGRSQNGCNDYLVAIHLIRGSKPIFLQVDFSTPVVRQFLATFAPDPVWGQHLIPEFVFVLWWTLVLIPLSGNEEKRVVSGGL